MSRTQRGFTLVELTMTIVLMGVLAVSARAVFFDRSLITPMLVKDQLISSIRLAQQTALARTAASPVTVTVSVSGSNFRFVMQNGGHSAVREVPVDGTNVTWSATSLTGSCSAVTGTLPHTLTFDSEGDTTRTRYCVVGDSTRRVCVSSLGFAYEGDCES